MAVAAAESRTINKTPHSSLIYCRHACSRGLRALESRKTREKLSCTPCCGARYFRTLYLQLFEIPMFEALNFLLSIHPLKETFTWTVQFFQTP